MAFERKDIELVRALRKTHPEGTRLCILGDCRFADGATLEDIAQMFGFTEVVTLDRVGSPSITLNLYEPIPTELLGRFDWIIDSGTLFWCFDVATAWRHTLSLLAPGGYILHQSALTGYFGRGYYSFEPRVFTDLYQANGFDIAWMGYRIRPHVHYLLRPLLSRWLDWRAISPVQQYVTRASRLSLTFGETISLPEPALLPNNAMIGCLAHKVTDVPFTIPLLS